MLYRHDHSVWLPYILFQTEGVTTVDRQLSCQYELTVKLVLNIRGQAHTIHYIKGIGLQIISLISKESGWRD